MTFLIKSNLIKNTFLYVILVLQLFFTELIMGKSNTQIIDLSGEWQFRMDVTQDANPRAGFRHKMKFPDKIHLPGSMDENGFGFKTTEKNPWKLNRLFEYVGVAFYRREVNIPADWDDKVIELFLERAHWETRLWIDDSYIDIRESLSTPHTYDVSKVLTPGKHKLTIRVDNSMKYEVGINAHSVTEHTQTNWNGLIGKIQLRARERLSIGNVRIFPDPDEKLARLQIPICNGTEENMQASVNLSAERFNVPEKHKTDEQRIKLVITKTDTILQVEHPMGDDVQMWDEFHPALYKMKITISVKTGNQNISDHKEVVFGMRSFKTRGTQILVNEHPTFLRGTLECCIFPLTGYPDMSVEGWNYIMKTIKAFGLNHMRFHSWCPPEAAFIAADHAGVYLHVEGPFWTKVGDQGAIDKYIYEEIDRILDHYANHPSFCMLAYGNEPSGENQEKFLNDLVKHWKARDGRRLYTSAAGWPVIPDGDFILDPQPRIQRWNEGLNSRVNRHPLNTDYDYREYISKYTVPVVSHEIGQWCVYPDFKEIKKYTGVLRARNFEIARESLKDHHMLDQAEKFLMASGKLQAILYKEEIESALRTPGFGGFQLLDLHDFPGQGTALVGVLNAFWQEKGYVSAREFSQFCGPVVPLLRAEKFFYTADEVFVTHAVCANYGPYSIKGVIPEWNIHYPDGEIFVEGKLSRQDIAQGGPVDLGKISVPLKNIDQAVQLKITLKINDYTNHWDLWIYPDQINFPTGGDVLISQEFNGEARKALETGEKVLLLADPGQINSNVVHGFSSIFWNTEWTNGQAPHTLGILCDPQHPALREFPTDYHSNWQWWDINYHGSPMILDDFPAEIQPIVQVIDDWNSNRRLGLVFEAKVGKGSLLICSADLKNNLDERPVARQLRYSLQRYVYSSDFSPRDEVKLEKIVELFKTK